MQHRADHEPSRAGVQPLVQFYGSRAEQVIGLHSTDRTKLVIWGLHKAQPHLNFRNALTGGNLHVYVK